MSTMQLPAERIYLCGPMSGVPQHNIPLFDYVATVLRNLDHTIVSPAELDDYETRCTALASKDGLGVIVNGQTWGDFLARDVKLIADGLDAICVLPNWQFSRGARLECFVGLLTDKKFYVWNPVETVMAPIDRTAIQVLIKENMP